MTPVKFEQHLESAGIISQLTFDQTLTSAATTAWGVDWNEDLIARDICQNFYDANREQLDQIRIEHNPISGLVTIQAPAEFNLMRLFFLGSEKGDSDIGQYGEGFKVAVVCLLKKFQVKTMVLSGHQALTIRLDDKTVKDTALTPLVYDYFTNSKAHTGTTLLLQQCPIDLAKALLDGMNHFYFAANPLLGEKIWSSYDDCMQVYHSTAASHGWIFYRNLRRGMIADIPVVIVINKPYVVIENRIATDRDRNAFGGQLMQSFYTIFTTYGIKNWSCSSRNERLVFKILGLSKSVWSKGSPLLAAIAGKSGGCTVDPQQVEATFGSGYFARRLEDVAKSKYRTADEVMQVREIEQAWVDNGRAPLPNYFAKFGVVDAWSEMEQRAKKAEAERFSMNRREATSTEMSSIELLKRLMQKISPSIVRFFSSETYYTVARTEQILGELRSKRAYKSREVFFSESFFVCDYPTAVAVFLHEHAHIFGHDGSRGFTDALTELIEAVIRHSSKIQSFSVDWAKQCAQIRLDRSITEDPIQVKLESLSSAELLKLVQGLPQPIRDEAIKKL